MKKILFFLLIFSKTFYSQELETNKTAMGWFDDKIGKINLPISSGIKFNEIYRTVEGHHRYFLNNKFNNTTIKYNNQFYYNIPAKYDIYSDNLIVFVKNYAGNFIIPKENYSFFLIDEKHSFYKYENKLFQKIYFSNSHTLLKQFVKKKNMLFEYDYTTYKFKQEVNFYVAYNDILKQIESKKDWIAIFPNQKKIIRQFYTKHKKVLKSSEQRFYINLIKTIEKN